MLAARLRQEGVDAVVYGDVNTNSPPVAQVHLFAGRSFRRHPLEVEAFRTAVRHWRSEPLAAEHTVFRRTEPGGRLDKSLEASEVPSEFRPRREAPGSFRYSPGFAIASQALEQRLRREVPVRPGTCDERPAVFAPGLRLPELFPQLRWDLSGGRVVQARGPVPEAIFMGEGVHVVPAGQGISVGGRHSSKNPDPRDELDCVERLTGVRYHEVSVWEGRRCAPTRDRWPVLGWIDEARFVFGGFGSRALFWLPHLTNLAVHSLGARSNEGLPAEVCVERLAGATEAAEPP